MIPFSQLDIGYIPTPNSLIEAVLELAQLREDDIFYDLGCGDGRMIITAAQKLGTHGVGIDLDPQRIQEANLEAKKAGVSHLVSFHQQNLFTAQFHQASVIFLYLLPHLNLRLRNRLISELRRGTRIISKDFAMGEWLPQKEKIIVGEEEATLYYWEIG